MKPLALTFLHDELGDATREVRGEVAPSVLDEVLVGMVGDLGYKAESPAHVEGVAYAAGRDVVFEGRVRADVGFDCVRCLTHCTLGLDLEVRHLLVARHGVDEGPAIDELVIEAGDDDEAGDETQPYDGRHVELVPLVREDVLLELPMNPDCEAATGVPCAAPLEQKREPEIDPRFAPLLELKKKLS